MNLEQAKAKLASVSSSTATKHPKVLVAELCAVVKFLLDEIERIDKTPKFVTLEQLDKDIQPHPPRSLPILPQENTPKRTPPLRTGPFRKGNAGDAE